MATIGTIAISLDSLCAADNHARLTLDLNGGEKIKQVATTVEDLIDPPINDDDIESFLRVLLKLGGRGKTKVQMKNVLQGGVVVTIDASAAP